MSVTYRVELDNLIIFPIFLITVSKILVTSGINSDGVQTTSEILDLTVKGGKKCKNWPDFPLGVSEATGGLIGDTVLICGGLGADECYSLTSEKITLVTHMSIWRFSAASIVIDDKTLWVTGDFFIGASTEYVVLNMNHQGLHR